MEKLIATTDALKDTIDPAFFSVTFGAGGSTQDRTLETVKTLQTNGVVNIAPHISGISSSKEQISELLQTYIDTGINKLVTLRGDIPEGGAASGDFSHGNELVRYIREQTDNHFHIEVAAYPEYHPESASPNSDFEHFSQKIAAGANSAITQYFYNIDAYINFMEKCEQANINIPVVPGIMPITNFKNLTAFSDRCGAEIPRWIRKQLEAYQDDTDSLHTFGADVVAELCINLLALKAPGLHFYTLNQPTATIDIWKRLNT